MPRQHELGHGWLACKKNKRERSALCALLDPFFFQVVLLSVVVVVVVVVVAVAVCCFWGKSSYIPLGSSMICLDFAPLGFVVAPHSYLLVRIAAFALGAAKMPCVSGPQLAG
jgi:hypothetical protein